MKQGLVFGGKCTELHARLDHQSCLWRTCQLSLVRGLDTVTASLAQIGYVCEWQTLRASDMGSPHQRERWFGVAYPGELYERTRTRLDNSTSANAQLETAYTVRQRLQQHSNNTFDMETQFNHRQRMRQTSGVQSADYSNGWQGFPCQPPLYRRDDGLSNRSYSTDRKRMSALGNAIVPQCAQLVAQQVLLSGLIETIWEIKNETT